jgi:hypothetical protein
MGCTILILVTGSGGFLRKREKKAETLHKILHRSQTVRPYQGVGSGERGDFSVISKQ